MIFSLFFFICSYKFNPKPLTENHMGLYACLSKNCTFEYKYLSNCLKLNFIEIYVIKSFSLKKNCTWFALFTLILVASPLQNCSGNW